MHIVIRRRSIGRVLISPELEDPMVAGAVEGPPVGVVDEFEVTEAPLDAPGVTDPEGITCNRRLVNVYSAERGVDAHSL